MVERERRGFLYTSHIQLGRSSTERRVASLSPSLSHTLTHRESQSTGSLSARHGHTKAQGHAVLPEQATHGPRWTTTPADHRDHLCSPPGSIFVSAAFQHVRESLSDLVDSTGAQDTDLIFLQGLMDSPVVCSLVKVSFHARDQSVCFYWFRRCF